MWESSGTPAAARARSPNTSTASSPWGAGKVTVDGTALAGKYDKKAIRTRVGMVFQYPEQQLFEETVEQDIAFGPQEHGAG